MVQKAAKWSAPSSIGVKTATGAVWLMAARIVTRVIDFVALIILAKLLTPSDFGLVAIAASVVLIADSASEIPINQALLRLDTLKQDHLDTAFSFGLVRGLVVGLVLILASHPLAQLFKDERLANLIIFLGISPIAKGLNSPGMVMFSRQLNFSKDFQIDTLSKLLALTMSTAFALITHNYWAVAVASVSSSLFVSAFSYIFAPYRPRLSFRSANAFLTFVGWSTGAQMITVVNWQSDRFLLGQFIPKSLLGEYSLADTISSLPDQVLINSTTRPLLAAFTQERGDAPRLRESYVMASATILAVGLPGLIWGSLLSQPLVRLLLGPAWAGSAEILSLLILSNVARLVRAPLLPIAMSLNQTKIFFTRSTWEICVKLPMLYLAISNFGVIGAVWTRLIMSLFNGLVEAVLLKKLLSISLIDQFAPLWRFACAALAMTLVLGVLSPLVRLDQPLWALLLSTSFAVLASGAAYFCTLIGLWLVVGRPSGFESTALTRLAALGAPIFGQGPGR